MIASPLAESTDFYRIDVNRKLDPKRKSTFGQFMTPAPIARFMAGMFEHIGGNVRFLDPGAGVGTLTAAFVDEIRKRTKHIDALQLTAYEIEPIFVEYLEETLKACSNTVATLVAEEPTADLRHADFIEDASEILQDDVLSTARWETFSHVLMNPPYKKINSNSKYRKLLRSLQIETSNLYTGFLALAIKLLQPRGELVAIVPRSFCNGPYFLPFRKLLLSEMAITRLHVFETRNTAFSEDSVLQENVILHARKGAEQDDVLISSSHGGSFILDEKSNELVSEDLTIRTIAPDVLVSPTDPQRFIHIAPSTLSDNVAVRMGAFDSTLEQLGLAVSTGPVVDFRLRAHIHKKPKQHTVPLIYPSHLVAGGVVWPKEGRKPNAIDRNAETNKWLMPNSGNYILTRRFTSKEERRRVVATVYHGDLPGQAIGFENHLNVFHHDGSGMEGDLAHGLAGFLNSSLLDMYFREFNGHTQVNATDLRSIRYPKKSILIRIGKHSQSQELDQDGLDALLEEELQTMIDSNNDNPLTAQKKIEEALVIIKALGLPRGQQNERSALTLLAILNLAPDDSWADAERPTIGITPIMEFCQRVYGKQYAPNTRETFRRQTMHQFVDAAIALYNPDKPERPVNSPKACYQISGEVYDVVTTFGTGEWDTQLQTFLDSQATLAEQYAKRRDMQMIPVVVAEGKEISLTPGVHSELIKNIITEFAPRFAPGAEVIYVGDTGDKVGYFQEEKLKELGVQVDRHGKMPDTVLYYQEKDWLLLIEAVTSHGPVDSKRHGELSKLFESAKPGLVYVTTFPDRAMMGRYLSEISWETEVWVVEAPTHMIHFDGERFLGPYD